MTIKKPLLAVTSFFILAPMLLGLFFWDSLPEKIVTSFDLLGRPAGFASKGFVLLGLPLILLLVHLLLIFLTSRESKATNIGSKMILLTYWFLPIVGLVCQSSLILSAIGELDLAKKPLFILLAFIFLALGNYLPKTRHNYTVGIRLPWTLADEDNWDKTHRLTGKIWVVGGLLFALMAIWPNMPIWPIFPVLLILLSLPPIASYHWRKP